MTCWVSFIFVLCVVSNVSNILPAGYPSPREDTVLQNRLHVSKVNGLALVHGESEFESATD